MRKRFLATTVLLVGAAVATPAAVPASASPPDKFELLWTLIQPDVGNELVVFVNIDRATYCTDAVVDFENAVIAWFNGEMVDPFPDAPEFPGGFDPVSVKLIETGQGAVVASAKGSGLAIELWNMDAPADRPLVGPCTDTDDGATLFAAGTARYGALDNDRFGSGTRGNAFGEFLQADVVDAHGNAYSYSHRFHVNDRCYEPEAGPPACLTDTFTLRAK